LFTNFEEVISCGQGSFKEQNTVLEPSIIIINYCIIIIVIIIIIIIIISNAYY